MSLVTEFTCPPTITPETWELLSASDKRQAHDSNHANGFRKSLEDFLRDLAKVSPEQRAETMTLRVNGLDSLKEKRRAFHSFLVGGAKTLPRTATSKTKFKESLDAYLAENLQDDGTFIKEITDDETGEKTIFKDFVMPEYVEKLDKETELTAYMKNATMERIKYNAGLSKLTKADLANIFSLMIGLLNFLFAQLAIRFPEKENQLPRGAAQLILHLISVRPADQTEFQMKDSILMAKTGIKSKTTIGAMRAALIEWQTKTGIGLVDIQRLAGNPGESDGMKYNLLVLDIIAEKANLFIEQGVSVANAQLAVSALTNGDEGQLKLLPAEVRESAENIITETAYDIDKLPEVSVNVTAQQQGSTDAAEKKRLDKAAAEEATQATRDGHLAGAFNDINAYRTAAPEAKTAELFEPYVKGLMIETRFDQTATLDEDEAKGRLESTLKRIEKDLILAFCLTERLVSDPNEAKQHINYITKLAQNIHKASKA